MANPTFVKDATTKTFRPGNIQATLLSDQHRQRRLVSSDGTVRVLEVSTVDDRLIQIRVVQLPRADDGSFAGYDSLRTFLNTTINWAQNTFTFTDADSDSFTVRWWADSLDLEETKKDVFEGSFLLRVEV